MSEIGEISQHELVSKKTKPEGGQVSYPETFYQWRREGDEGSSHLINKSKNKNRPLWTDVGKSSYRKDLNEKIHGMHPLWNSGRSDEAFFYIEKIAEKNPEPYVRPTTIQETPPLTFSPEGRGINLWAGDYKKNRLYNMCARSGEEPFVAMHLKENKLLIAHKGDYRAVLGKEGKPEVVTEYVPPEEEATVTEHTLPKGESQLILGSAGLWDFMSPEEAMQLIAQMHNAEEASNALREEAYKRAQLKNGTVGDISVMVMNLNAPEKRTSLLSKLRHQKAERNYRQKFTKAA